jgi:hypothetical protein
VDFPTLGQVGSKKNFHQFSAAESPVLGLGLPGLRKVWLPWPISFIDLPIENGDVSSIYLLKNIKK